MKLPPQLCGPRGLEGQRLLVGLPSGPDYFCRKQGVSHQRAACGVQHPAGFAAGAAAWLSGFFSQSVGVYGSDWPVSATSVLPVPVVCPCVSQCARPSLGQAARLITDCHMLESCLSWDHFPARLAPTIYSVLLVSLVQTKPQPWASGSILTWLFQ